MNSNDMLSSVQQWVTRVSQWNQNQSIVGADTLLQQQNDLTELAEFIEGVFGTIKQQVITINSSHIVSSLNCVFVG